MDDNKIQWKCPKTKSSSTEISTQRVSSSKNFYVKGKKYSEKNKNC
jgi:hypothetical protein